MNKRELIEELISDLCLLSNDGLPHLKSERSVGYIYEFFESKGMVDFGRMVIENLFEDDKEFKNPDLNKVISYTNVNGEKAEGKVGNLLRRPDTEDAYIQAVKALGGKESDRYKTAMDDLGSEGQPNRDIEKEREKGDESGESEVGEEPQTGTAFDPKTKGGEVYLKGLPDNDPVKPAEFIEKEPTKRLVAGKDKTLKTIDSLSTEVFNQSIEPDDDEFRNRNTKLANPVPPPPFSFDETANRKFPKKYISVLERMMNTRATGDATKWSHFSDLAGGAGQISAQAGELMVMMGVGMNDSEFEQFANTLLNYEKNLIEQNPDLKPEGKRIISKSWIEAAKNNRSAILKRVQKEYPQSEIIATAWDTENDVNALGLENYSENKGFSTDVYLKIKTKDGEEILDEVSLKKSTMVYFLNSGAGKFSQWDDDLPDEINQNVYRDRGRERLVSFGKGIDGEIQNILEKGGEDAEFLNSLFKSKKVDFKTALLDTENGKGSRAKSKVILEGIKLLAKNGNQQAQMYLDETSQLHKEFQTAAIKAITENPKMKQGMLQEIRSEFPLKAVSEGEETMAIGPNSLDRKIMEEIFGTSNFDIIKEKLIAEPGPPPYIGYKAEVGDTVIPLAEINIREDGVGYGGQVKFEMQLDKRFAKILENANRKVYS